MRMFHHMSDHAPSRTVGQVTNPNRCDDIAAGKTLTTGRQLLKICGPAICEPTVKPPEFPALRLCAAAAGAGLDPIWGCVFKDATFNKKACKLMLLAKAELQSADYDQACAGDFESIKRVCAAAPGLFIYDRKLGFHILRALLKTQMFGTPAATTKEKDLVRCLLHIAQKKRTSKNQRSQFTPLHGALFRDLFFEIDTLRRLGKRMAKPVAIADGSTLKDIRSDNSRVNAKPEGGDQSGGGGQRR